MSMEYTKYTEYYMKYLGRPKNSPPYKLNASISMTTNLILMYFKFYVAYGDTVVTIFTIIHIFTINHFYRRCCVWNSRDFVVWKIIL